MPALAGNPVNPFGPKTVTAAGTPELLFSVVEGFPGAQGQWPTRVARLRLEALPNNTGLVYIGVKGMNKNTLAKVIATIAPPNGNPIVNGVEFDQLAMGANNYKLHDYWIDVEISSEGVLRTVWIA